MYKILLLGTNKAVIDDIFHQLTDTFEILSSSLRYEDIMNHIKYVNPDTIIYCLNGENREDMSKMVSIKSKSDTPLTVIGSESDCNDFEHCAVNIADLILFKPISAQKIKVSILSYLKAKELETKELEAKSQKANEEEQALKAALEEMINSDEPKTVTSLTNDVVKPLSARKHILVVDDDVQMLKTIKYFLEDDYDVATAINGTLALRFLQKKHTDLVLLDYEMPNMKGAEVLEKIRGNKATKDIPVIFLTGIADREIIKQVLALSPQGYILKPTDRNTLHTKISAVLRQSYWS
ncbi:MAG: response regulator [Eubacterium sp.]